LQERRTHLLRLCVTRDSVAAGDDFDPPHTMRVEVLNISTALEGVSAVLRLGYLPYIAGGKASWVVSAGSLFAVYAQQWQEPKALWRRLTAGALENGASELRLHFSYLAQIDPDMVFDVLCRCTFDANDV
jgi:hypothetical protein